MRRRGKLPALQAQGGSSFEQTMCEVQNYAPPKAVLPLCRNPPLAPLQVESSPEAIRGSRRRSPIASQHLETSPAGVGAKQTHCHSFSCWLSVDNDLRNLLRSCHRNPSMEIYRQWMVGLFRDDVRTISTGARMDVRLESVSCRIVGEVVAEPPEKPICGIGVVIGLDVSAVALLA